MPTEVNWEKALQPLLNRYRGKRHPLNYKNPYQLVVMVILSAQTRDNWINDIAPTLFKAFPDMKSLAKATPAKLNKYLSKVRGHDRKIRWLIALANEVKREKNIPTTMEGLVGLPGIGRKSANVIMREMHLRAEGVIIDLHVIRVANRIGIAKGDKQDIIEAQLMNNVPQKDWGEIGMAISFLGRETCRRSHPIHDECVMQDYCSYFQSKL